MEPKNWQIPTKQVYYKLSYLRTVKLLANSTALY